MADLTSALSRGLSGSYTLERSLGDGGMSTVWLAQDLKHERPVALKVLKPELAKNLGPERFRREITTAARLQHPHILSVHDSGETAGQFWFTMPYVEGESVRQRLVREHRLPMGEALRIVREAAQALQYAHEHGVVHRDIKPENLLLTRDGSTLVADFGLARIVGNEAAGTAQLTQVGTAIGTPAYMSPEQATGDDDVDPRADQYALAVTLYEMLAGEPPWRGATTAALMAQRFTAAPPSVRAKRPEVPTGVDQALQRAMAVKADARFGSVIEFATALTSAADASALRGRRRAMLAGAALLLALGAGAAFALRRGQAATSETTSPSGATRLAVLPFENLGDTADAYFADGIADELRGKLTSVPGLEVIARSSSVQYRGTTKPPQEIAKELGVRFLLTGTVRWEKRADQQGRVRVSPELIEVSPNGAPATKWQQPFDAALTDVFQVQSGIASQVATALDVALGAATQKTLASRPTKDLQAWDAYLRGEAAWGNGNNGAPEAIRRAQVLFEDAARRDSSFALAWARLARAHLTLYADVAPRPEDAEAARGAVARAVALAPDDPATVIAKGFQERLLDRDFERSLTTLRAGLARAPSDAELVGAVGYIERVVGDTLNARRHLQQAAALDPRSAVAASRLSRYLIRLRDFPSARVTAERAYALGQDVSNLHELVMVSLAEGDLPRARSYLAEGDDRFGRPTMLPYVAVYYDTYWALDSADRRILTTLGPERFGGERTVWALTQAQVHHLIGNEPLARAYADSARLAYEQQLRGTPNDPQSNVLYGLALAYLGRGEEARSAGERGAAMAPIAKDAWSGPYYQHQLARIHLLLGDKEKAIDVLEPLLTVPYHLSPGWLRIDPTFDPLRGHPRFEKLASGG
ncbi:MAG TPA: protein kinase [Gemmatimonadales bacterium]|nr:protein kinase [Gemmatimonadales bacterium]